MALIRNFIIISLLLLTIKKREAYANYHTSQALIQVPNIQVTTKYQKTAPQSMYLQLGNIIQTRGNFKSIKTIYQSKEKNRNLKLETINSRNKNSNRHHKITFTEISQAFVKSVSKVLTERLSKNYLPFTEGVRFTLGKGKHSSLKKITYGLNDKYKNQKTQRKRPFVAKIQSEAYPEEKAQNKMGILEQLRPEFNGVITPKEPFVKPTELPPAVMVLRQVEDNYSFEWHTSKNLKRDKVIFNTKIDITDKSRLHHSWDHNKKPHKASLSLDTSKNFSKAKISIERAYEDKAYFLSYNISKNQSSISMGVNYKSIPFTSETTYDFALTTSF